MSSAAGPAKRPFTDETHATQVQASISAHPSTPADLALQLQSVGSRVRKNVMEGYTTHRFASAPPSPSKQSAIFSSANEILHDIYASAPAHPPISPRKRPRDDDSDRGFANMPIDADVERGEDTESDGDTVIILDARVARPVKPRPRRGLIQTRSLPNGVFGVPGGPVSGQGLEDMAESDWSINGSGSQPPAFEPMVL
ncbi:hypothetical protein B0H15DRAFT_829277 [Mycena belliarum]|uniref:Uncharacterized protein n=1 Tax=Mycena belliarum TaxID=1033014 RepID=A0AAD6UDW6_9AGAR|nr:hypothetical protein B0H15DRAFT_829277 [Mycena belliae]